MVVRIVLALGLQLSLSVALRAQVVCQVIENIGCPTITEQNCPDMNSCIPKPGFAKEQCTDDAVRKVAGATRHGVRPADPGESGHFAANHVGSNYCKQTR